jgi:hypothetical protein
MMVRSMCFSPRALVLPAVVGLVFAFAGAATARAGIVVLGNLGSSGTDTANLVNNQSFYLSTTDSAVATSKAYAQGFTTGTTNLSLTSASMYLNTRTVGSGTLTLKLWGNSGGVPGTELASASLAVSGTFALRTWNITHQFSPNTSYWLGFEGFSGQYDGRPAMDPSDNGRINPSVQNASGYSWISAARISGTGGSWFAVPLDTPFTIDRNLNAGSLTITAVPEPSQIVIALGGLATLGLWRLRRLRRGNGRGRKTSASGGLLS